MTMIDVSKLRQGDIVHVRVMVADFSEPAIHAIGLRAMGSVEDFYAREEDIVAVETRPIQVGDRVQLGADINYEVIAVCGVKAWVHHANDFDKIANISALTRVE